MVKLHEFSESKMITIANDSMLIHAHKFEKALGHTCLSLNCSKKSDYSFEIVVMATTNPAKHWSANMWTRNFSLCADCYRDALSKTSKPEEGRLWLELETEAELWLSGIGRRDELQLFGEAIEHGKADFCEICIDRGKYNQRKHKVQIAAFRDYSILYQVCPGCYEKITSDFARFLEIPEKKEDS